MCCLYCMNTAQFFTQNGQWCVYYSELYIAYVLYFIEFTLPKNMNCAYSCITFKQKWIIVIGSHCDKKMYSFDITNNTWTQCGEFSDTHPEPVNHAVCLTRDDTCVSMSGYKGEEHLTVLRLREMSEDNTITIQTLKTYNAQSKDIQITQSYYAPCMSLFDGTAILICGSGGYGGDKQITVYELSADNTITRSFYQKNILSESLQSSNCL